MAMVMGFCQDMYQQTVLYHIKTNKEKIFREGMVVEKSRKNSGMKKAVLHIKISFEKRPDFKESVTAFAFDCRGNLLSSGAAKDGHAKLVGVDGSQAKRARIFFAPTLPKNRQDQPTLEMMERLHAYEPVWRFTPEVQIQEILPVPGNLLDYWIWCLCRVRGRVVRPVPANGSMEDRPVCNARVHICEVDKFHRFIMRLPDYEVFRLRDDFIRELAHRLPDLEKIPGPIPDPGPLRDSVAYFQADPRVVDPSPENIARMNRTDNSDPALGFEYVLEGVAEQMPPLRETQKVSIKTSSAAISPLKCRSDMCRPDPQPEPLCCPSESGRSTQDTSLSMLSDKSRVALRSPSALIVRDALIANADLILPFLCYWPWWRFVCDELLTIKTDRYGRFDTCIGYLCAGDKPDLYFWVEYWIEGSWQTVYKPPKPCYTYWNYECGDEVTIRVTDPRVPACEGPPDLPELQVAIMSIGNYIGISEILPASAGADEGLTTDTTGVQPNGVAIDGRPFGGKLEPHVWFSRSALIAVGITHYRWSYKRLTGPDGVTPNVGTWQNMTRNVVRHYSVIDPITDDLSFPAESLGPDPLYPGKDLFRIQPIDPPSPGIDWEVRDAREDLASAHFETHKLEGGNAQAAAGKYKIKLELFNPTVSVDIPVNLTDAGVQLKVSDKPAPIGTGTDTTIPAPPANLIVDAGKVTGFKMVLRVDNNPCQAEIYTIFGTGLSIDPYCGFVEYTSGADVSVTFKAWHPNKFGTLRFKIHRGTATNVPEASVFGSIAPGTLLSYAGSGDPPFTRDAGGLYSKSAIPVTTMLSSNTPSSETFCKRAAFAETLYVWSLATDGWTRLSGLDASGIPVAFALSEPCPGECT
jgi:hypothetical protein